MNSIIAWFAGSLAGLVLYKLSPLLCLIFIIVSAVIYFLYNRKKETKYSATKANTNPDFKDNDVIEELKTAISTHKSYINLTTEEKKQCLLNLKAEAIGILRANERQQEQFKQMPENFAKQIETNVIRQFAPVVKEARLRCVAIDELLNELQENEKEHFTKKVSPDMQSVSVNDISVSEVETNNYTFDDDD